MNKAFSDWWEIYIKSEKCVLKKTPWSYSEVGFIKDALEAAFLHKQPLETDGQKDGPRSA